MNINYSVTRDYDSRESNPFSDSQNKRLAQRFLTISSRAPPQISLSTQFLFADFRVRYFTAVPDFDYDIYFHTYFHCSHSEKSYSFVFLVVFLLVNNKNNIVLVINSEHFFKRFFSPEYFSTLFTFTLLFYVLTRRVSNKTL